MTLQQSVWKGLNYTANYQWASAFADSTQYASWDRHVAHGRDSNVRLQQLTWYGTYDLPFGKGKQFGAGVNTMTDMIIGGWQLSGTVNVAGGLPFTLNYQASTSLPGSAPVRAIREPRDANQSHGVQAGSSGTLNGSSTTENLEPAHRSGQASAGIRVLTTLETWAATRILAPDSGVPVLPREDRHVHEHRGRFRFDAYNANHIAPGTRARRSDNGTITGGAAGYARQLNSLRVQF